MKTLREQLNITPTDQRMMAKYITEKLTSIMLSLGGEDKINQELDKILSTTTLDDNTIYKFNYQVECNTNNFKLWLNEFRKRGKK